MLPAVLRRGAGLPLACGAAGAATWHKPQAGLEPGDARLCTVTVTTEGWLSLRTTERHLCIRASGDDDALAQRCARRAR